MNVIIGNLPGNTGEHEVRDILREHGVPVTEVTLTNEGNEDVAVAVVALDTDHVGAEALVRMVDGKHWRGRTLHARTATFFTGEGMNR